MKVAIFGRTASNDNLESFKLLTQTLKSLNCEYIVFEDFYELISQKLDCGSNPTFTTHSELLGTSFLITIGGDGTLLRTIQLVRDSGIPILGINTGRLGYLASTTKEEIEDAINQLMNSNFSLDKRSLIGLTQPNLFPTNYALNEFTVSKKDISSMITIHTYLDGEYLNSYWADGLIVSTPTGSTGYSLSCGGPIILPEANNFVLAPIAPHNLTARPLVIPDNVEIKLKTEAREEQVLVSLDGTSKSIDSNTELILKKENFTINLVNLHSNNYLKTLRNKLMWGLDKRN